MSLELAEELPAQPSMRSSPSVHEAVRSPRFDFARVPVLDGRGIGVHP
jgi:hypothetical protein